MQLDGLMNILAPKGASKSSAAANGASPAEGLTEALQGGFESILSDIQSTVMQTAEGIGEALSEVPEALAQKVEEMLSAMGELTEGTPLESFLSSLGVEPQVLGVSNQEAKALVFDGDTFVAKGTEGELSKLKTFDLPAALEKLQTKLESLTELVKNGLETEGESLKVFTDEFKSLRTGGEHRFAKNETRRPAFFESADDFVKARETSIPVKNNVTSTYAKNSEQNASMFSKYAQEVDVPVVENSKNQKQTVVSSAVASEAMGEQLIMPEAVTGVAQKSADVSGKTNTQVLDMNSLGSAKPSEVITRIVNYLDQQQLTSKGELDVIVKHDDLGQFKLNVARGAEKGAVDMTISANGEGHRFFTEHEVELVKTLNQNGIRLSDFKVVQGDKIIENSNAKSGSFAESGHGEGRGQFGQSHQGRSGHNQNGENRRRQLWEDYRERMGASA